MFLRSIHVCVKKPIIHHTLFKDPCGNTATSVFLALCLVVAFIPFFPTNCYFRIMCLQSFNTELLSFIWDVFCFVFMLYEIMQISHYMLQPYLPELTEGKHYLNVAYSCNWWFVRHWPLLKIEHNTPTVPPREVAHAMQSMNFSTCMHFSDTVGTREEHSEKLCYEFNWKTTRAGDKFMFYHQPSGTNVVYCFIHCYLAAVTWMNYVFFHTVYLGRKKNKTE